MKSKISPPDNFENPSIKNFWKTIAIDQFKSLLYFVQKNCAQKSDCFLQPIDRSTILIMDY